MQPGAALTIVFFMKLLIEQKICAGFIVALALLGGGHRC
jgi:hypothetical protein